ncbi:MAG: MFS transporter [Pseudomonadota bacterium]
MSTPTTPGLSTEGQARNGPLPQGLRVAILCLALGQTVTWAGVYYIFAALLPRWELTEGWPKTGLAAAFAGAIAVSALAAPLAGRLIDRGHGPLLLTGSTLLGAVSIGLLPLAASTGAGLALFFPLWLCAGLAMAGALYEPCFALITRCLDTGARRAITTVTLIAGFAGALSFPTAHLISEASSWQAATTTAALATALIAAPLAWIGANRLETARPSPAQAASPDPSLDHSTQSRRWSDPVFAPLALGFATIAIGHGGIIAHILPLLSERGVAEGTAVLAASCIGPMQVFGRLAMRLLETRTTAHAVTRLGFVAVIAAALSILVASLAPGLTLYLLPVFVVLQGMGYGVMSVMRPVRTRELLGQRDFGAISGALALPYLMAAALAPFLGALLWFVGGYDLVLLFTAAALAAGLMLYLRASALGRGSI